MGSHGLHCLCFLYRATLCTLIDTNFCKPDDGQARPKHVADVTCCRIQLSFVLCKDGLIKKNLSYSIHGGMEAVQFKLKNVVVLAENRNPISNRLDYSVMNELHCTLLVTTDFPQISNKMLKDCNPYLAGTE